MEEFVRQLERAESLVDAGLSDIMEIVNEQLEVAGGDVASNAQAIDLLVQEIAGRVEIGVDPAAEQVRQVVDRRLSDISKEIEGRLTDLGRAEVNVPYDLGVMEQMLSADPADWLPAVLPALAGVVCDVRVGHAGCPTPGTPLPLPVPYPPADPPQVPIPPVPPAGCVNCSEFPNNGSVPTALGLPPEGLSLAQILSYQGMGQGDIRYTNAAGRQCVYNVNTGLATCFPNPGEPYDPLLFPYHADPDRKPAVPYCEPGATPAGVAVQFDGSVTAVLSWCGPSPVPPADPLPPDSPVPTVPPTDPFPVPTPPGCCPTVPPVVNVYPAPAICPTPPPVIVNIPPPTVPPAVPTSPPSPPASPPAATIPGIDLPPNVLGIDWGHPIDSCNRICNIIRPTEEFNPGSTIRTAVRAGYDWFKRNLSTYAATIPGMQVLSWSGVLSDGGAIGEIASQQTVGQNLLKKVVDQLDLKAVPEPDAAIGYAGTLILAGWAERLTSAPVSYLTQSVEYAFRACNPQYIPDQPMLDELSARKKITDVEWDCMTLAHGNHLHWAEMSADLRVGRPGANELVQLYLRGKLTVGEFEERMTDIGWSRGEWQQELVELSNQYPTLGDQIRFMVRDANDQTTVDKYQLDKDFRKKFNADARELARATGVPEFAMKLNWRSHWQIPSNTQLYDELHRLRKDRPERAAWEQQFPRIEGETEWDYHHRGPPVVLVADVKEALEVNDLAPGWVDPAIAISYRPITNTDAVRAFQIGKFSKDRLKQAFLDNGYADADADTLVEFHVPNSKRMLATQLGVLTSRNIRDLYASGAMTRNEADTALEAFLPDFKTRQELLDRIDLEVETRRRDGRIKRTRKQLLTGQIDRVSAEIRLRQIGVTPAKADLLSTQWVDERDNSAKFVSAALACRLRGHGLLTAVEHYDRLRNLGYDNDYANRIVRMCEQDIAKKTAAELKQAAKEAEALERRNAKDTESYIKKLVALYPDLACTLNPLIGKPVPKTCQNNEGGESSEGGGEE